MAKKLITAKEFDEKFDRGEDISEYLDTERAYKKEHVDVNVDVLNQIDSIASEIRVTRQSLIKFWLHERLQDELDKKMRRAKIG